jgi:hypothetical protein
MAGRKELGRDGNFRPPLSIPKVPTLKTMVRPSDIQTNVHTLLFFARLRIVADGSPQLYLSRLNGCFSSFSKDPVSSVRGRFEGSVSDFHFHFHRVEWFSGRINPRCSGTVSQLASGKILISATVQAVPFFFGAGWVCCVLLCFFLGFTRSNSYVTRNRKHLCPA